MDFILIENAGQKITSTNYWGSDYAQEGFVYLSWNAGAARLLVPDNRVGWLKEMRTAKYVIVSRGAWPDRKKPDAYELLFEDNSDSPFCILHTQPETARP